MVSESGFDRAKMIQPEVMAPPLLWLVCKNRSKPTPDFGRKRQVISAESGT